MNTSTQIKALIRNLSKDKKINAQILLRNFMLERLLERISLSAYKHNFILKGGMLIAAMVGLDARSTMDMDATIKGIPITKEILVAMFEEILKIPLDDGVLMTVSSVLDIRDDDEYNGYRLSFSTLFDGIKQTLKVDITTGDIVTPQEVSYKFDLMLENRSIEVLAYNIETVLAEKLETIITRGTANTRMRDFYDVYIISKLQAKNIDKSLLSQALTATATKRGTIMLIDDAMLIISELEKSEIMQGMWLRYQKKFSYAEGILWEEATMAVGDILESK